MEHKISTEWVDIADTVPGEPAPMSAYLARPATPGSYPNVLVAFEMFGITGYVRDVADRLASLGYNALVPDFYHRQGHRIELSTDAAGRSRGFELLHGITREGVRNDVRAARDHLADRAGGGGGTAMLGLSVGGHIAYYAATQLPLAALIVAYPGWLAGTEIPLSRPEPTLTLTRRIAALGTPVLFLVGAADHLVTAGQRADIARQLQDSGVRHEMVVYPDTPHGFLCPERDTYRQGAAADAWARTVALLADTLAPR